MIHFTFRLENPWAGGNRKQRDFFCKSWKIAGHKHLEMQLTWFDWQTIFEIHAGTHWRGQDHAGPRFELTVLGLFFNIQLYDSRHWNHDTNAWYTEEEILAEANGWEREDAVARAIAFFEEMEKGKE